MSPKISFREPMVSHQKEFIPAPWVTNSTTAITRQSIRITSAIQTTNMVTKCICMKNMDDNSRCAICGIQNKRQRKRIREYICDNCSRGNPLSQVACRICGEMVHSVCYSGRPLCYVCDESQSQLCKSSLACDQVGSESMSRLHNEGFAVHRKAFKLSNDCIQSIHKSRFLPIFNGIDDNNSLLYDGKRLMAQGEWGTEFRRTLKSFLNQTGYMNSANGTKELKDAYALKSLAGCQMQPKHADSAIEEGLRKCEPSDVPLAILYAIEDETKLKIWRFDYDHPSVVILSAGDLVIFRGDTAHAGFKYNSTNTRLHAYIDSTVHKRIKGKTYILLEDQYVKTSLTS